MAERIADMLTRALESAHDTFAPPPTVSSTIAQLLALLPGRAALGPRISGAAVMPMRPFRVPVTSVEESQLRPANMNPPPKLEWRGPEPIEHDPLVGQPGYRSASDTQGRNLVSIADRWNWTGDSGHYTYQPQISRLVPGDATTVAHSGPQFRSPDVARQYAEELLRRGQFDATPSPEFAAPFVARDAELLRSLEAEQARKGFQVVKPDPMGSIFGKE